MPLQVLGQLGLEPQVRKGLCFGGRSLVHERTGTLYSESTITARIRDLRKPKCGRWEVLSRKREGARSWEYQLSDGD